eukprot:1195985-Lingulodinium_polyedra.AAC.1
MVVPLPGGVGNTQWHSLQPIDWMAGASGTNGKWLWSTYPNCVNVLRCTRPVSGLVVIRGFAAWL